MYHKQVNKTAVQSQHMIADALFSLMKRKPFQQITVTEICDEAAIGRKTFYRNFDMKEDVVDFKLDILCAQYKEELMGMTTDQQLRHHLEFTRDYADYFIALYNNGIRHPFAGYHATVDRGPRGAGIPEPLHHRRRRGCGTGLGGAWLRRKHR